MGEHWGFRRVWSSVGTVAVAALIVGGCAPAVDDAAPPPSTSPSASPSPSSPSASPSAPAVEPSAPAGEPEEPTPAPSSGPTQPSPAPQPSEIRDAPLRGLAFSIDCDRMLTPQQVYDYNPNVGADPGFAPRGDSGPERTRELSGTACGWINQTSGRTIAIGVARFDAMNLERVRDLARASGGTTSGLGMDGYYRTQSGLGVVDAFTGSYWIAAESSTFLAPEDVAPLLDAIRSNLP